MILGARKWKVGLGVNQTEFRKNILQIYPLLISVPGYTIWFINKNKQFEQLSIQVSFHSIAPVMPGGKEAKFLPQTQIYPQRMGLGVKSFNLSLNKK